jgi:hypothetical protein
MTSEIRCLQCSEEFPAHVVEQFGGMCPACVAGFAQLPGPAAEAALRPGSTFGRYEILDVIGRGGMGVVYRARQPGLDREVALKVLSPRLAADREFVDRFEREAKALARLSHPSIVSVHDCGVEGGTPYLSMELVDGESLREILAEGRLPPARALRIVPQLCDALEYAHSQGVVHRDIKPENILIDRRGRVKIADFGLAMILGAGSPRLTQTHAVMGTPHYMAPEQVENPKAVDHRADIYSMGVVLYEMLTGELPIGAFARPSEKAEVHRRLDEIILRALAKEPDRRYQKASQLKLDVTRVPRDPAAPPGVVRGYEWKSPRKLLGWPLVHIALGLDGRGRPVPARGWFAFGLLAMGFMAVGPLALGILAIGGLALGGLAWGGAAVGGVAIGEAAGGYYAYGARGGGQYVFSRDRRDREAERFFSHWIAIPRDVFWEGMRAYEAKDRERAIALLSQVTVDHPNFPTAVRILGYELFSREGGSPEMGLRILTAARQARPNDPLIEEAFLRVMDLVQRKSAPGSKTARTVSGRGEEPAIYFPEAKESDPPETDDNEDYHQMKGDSKDFLSYIKGEAGGFRGRQAGKTPGVYDTMGVGVGGGGGGRMGGRFGDRFGGRENLVARGGGTRATESAVLQALKWLARHQGPDGGWGAESFLKRCVGDRCGGSGERDFDTGVTALSLLAFLGAGYSQLSRDEFPDPVSPGQVLRFGEVVKKGVQWLIAHQDPDGCIGERGPKHLYNHLVAAVCLSEAVGMTASETLKEPAQKAIDFVVAAQNPGKGWRYSARSGDNDSSVTGWAVQALRSAELSGLTFPKSAEDGALAWYQEATEPGGYFRVGYTARGAGRVSVTGKGPGENFDDHPAMSALGVLARILIRKRTDEPALGAVNLLMGDLPEWRPKKIDFYYWHSASMALFQYDGPEGAMWRKWNEPMMNALVPHQRSRPDGCKAGSWDPDVDRWGFSGGRVYAAAINALTLEVYYRNQRALGSGPKK